MIKMTGSIMAAVLFQGICQMLLTGFSAAAGPAPVSAGSSGLVISADMQFAYAESLYLKEDYPAAEFEFKRFSHFFSTDSRQTEAAFKTGMALFFQERLHDSARQFNDLIENSGTGEGFDFDLADPFVLEAFFMQSRAFMRMDNFGYARVVLQNLLMMTDDPFLRNRAFLALARLHIQASLKEGIDELDQAMACLEKMDDVSGGRIRKPVPEKENQDFNQLESEKHALIELVKDVRKSPQKNPVLAGIFSLVPGGGFLYTGRFQDAMAAFGLNAGLIWAACTAFEDDNPALGGVISFVGAGFYTGGIYGSVAAAHKYNHARKVEILNREFSFRAGISPGTPGVMFSLSRPF